MDWRVGHAGAEKDMPVFLLNHRELGNPADVDEGRRAKPAEIDFDAVAASRAALRLGDLGFQPLRAARRGERVFDSQHDALFGATDLHDDGRQVVVGTAFVDQTF